MSGHKGTHDSEHHCKLGGSTKRAKTYGTCTYNCSTLGKRLLRMSLTQRARAWAGPGGVKYILRPYNKCST